jgi:TPR repeat protein
VGVSIPHDSKRGLQLCEKAASLGDVDAIKWLVSTYLFNETYQDYKKVNLWNKKLIAQYTIRANKGDVSAMVNLVEEYYLPPSGTGKDAGKLIPGAEKDANKALAWAEKAAALGSRDALFLLGHIYEDKDFSNHDCKKARDFYDRAAALGERNAGARLGARAKGATMLDCDF